LVIFFISNMGVFMSGSLLGNTKADKKIPQVFLQSLNLIESNLRDNASYWLTELYRNIVELVHHYSCIV
jgi:hypothetical protein